jgi:GNAT superfamily N-acetyltransferase
MIRTASRHDLDALAALFTRANESPYNLSAVAEEKCFGHGIAGAPTTRVFERDGMITGAAVTCGKWLRILAVDRDLRRQGIGAALLRDAESLGAKVVFAEPGNYLTPGTWIEDHATRAFFTAQDYEQTQSTWNLEVDLAFIGETSDVIRPTHADAERVLAFVEREFGRVWRFEAAKAFEREPRPAFITVDANVVTGFAVHDVNNRGLGFFGPTGVMKSMRGRGAGCRLLLASLADLRSRGFERVVIPWTDALAFYEKCCGATAAHRFVSMQKRTRLDAAAT